MYNPSPLAFVYPPSDECLELSFHLLFTPGVSAEAARLSLGCLSDAVELNLLTTGEILDLLTVAPLTQLLECTQTALPTVELLQVSMELCFSGNVPCLYFLPLLKAAASVNNNVSQIALEILQDFYLRGCEDADFDLLDEYLQSSESDVALGTARLLEAAGRIDINLTNVVLRGLYNAQDQVNLFNSWCALYKKLKKQKSAYLSKCISKMDKDTKLCIAIAELCLPSPANLTQRKPYTFTVLQPKMTLLRYCIDPFAKKLMKVSECEIYIPLPNCEPLFLSNLNIPVIAADVRESLKIEMQQLCRQLKHHSNVDQHRLVGLEKTLLSCLDSLVLENKAV